MTTPISPTSGSNESNRGTYLWKFPGAPIRITMPLGLISRLRAELEQQALSDCVNDAEVGGVLLGYQETGTTIEIADYVWVSRKDYSASRYRLDTLMLEWLRLEHSDRDGTAGRRLMVVGYFRTQFETKLRLRDEEIGLVREHFGDPANVVLLIQTATQPPTAGYFFWMAPGVIAPVSFKTFPFDAGVLGSDSQKNPATAMVPQSVGSMEIARPFPITSVEVAAPILESEFAGTWPPLVTTTEQEPTHFFLGAPAVAALVLASAAVAGLMAFVLRDGRPSETAQRAAVALKAPAAPPLQFEVEAQGDGLKIRWNPRSDVVTKAREGHLVIQEGNSQLQTISLDQQQLMSGYIYYRSTAERIQFQLGLGDDSGNVYRETVLALSSKPRPEAPPVTHQQTENGPSEATSRAIRIESTPSPGPDSIRLAANLDALPNRASTYKTSALLGVARQAEPDAAREFPPSTVRDRIASDDRPPTADALSQTRQFAASVPAVMPTKREPISVIAGEALDANAAIASVYDAPKGPIGSSVTPPGAEMSLPVTVTLEPISRFRLTSALSKIPLMGRLKKPEKVHLPAVAYEREVSLNADHLRLLQRFVTIGVKVSINSSGKVETAEVEEYGEPPDWTLAKAALTAAEGWAFQPVDISAPAVSNEFIMYFHFTPSGTSAFR